MARWLVRAERLPIRVRLTIAFAAVMAAVLAAAGVFLYSQFAADLDAQLDAALRAEATDLAALVEQGGAGALTASGEPLAQVFGAGGRPVASTRRAALAPLLTAAEARRATRRRHTIPRRELPAGAVRIRAVPARAPGGRRVAVVVADRLARRDRELARLRTLLLIAGPLALLLASLAGHEVARAALAPVDRMRRQAARITEQDLSERLPVPAPADEVSALGRTLNAMLDRVEAAVARERRVVSDASHELRTPLTTLRAEVDLALRGDRDPAELRAALQSAAEEAAPDVTPGRRPAGARARRPGTLPLHPERLDARDLLDAAAGRSRAAARMGERSIVVAADGRPDLAVRADRDRAAQTLDNLISNAAAPRRRHDHAQRPRGRRAGRAARRSTRAPAFATSCSGARSSASPAAPAPAAEPRSGLGLALVEALALAQGGQRTHGTARRAEPTCCRAAAR